ncbi:MAG: hypothetical protein LQ338_004494 [Usnochroma carphineum]|nr:MAG: hypothetical protein LQ338_004494 [Usnochroma carphineum]
MPTLNFAFGIGKYFNFTFSLQLGQPSPNQAESARHGESTFVGENLSPVQTLGSTSDRRHGDQAVPEQPLNELSESTLNTQPSSYHTPVQHASRSGDTPITGNTSISAATKPVINRIRPLPRTPKSRTRTIPPLIPRRKSRTKHFLFSSVARQSKYVPIRARAPSPEPVQPSSQQLPSPPESNSPGTPRIVPLSFQILPLEIKHMIYRQLLVSAEPIKKPHKLVCNKRSIMLDSIQPVRDIDSSILRACRSIYHEALPVLYGQNTFEFAKPRKLRDFSHAYLDKRNPRFAFREAEAGRFTLIRSVILRLGYDRKPYAFQRPIPGAPTVPDRKRIWSHWHQYFFNDNDSRNQYDWGWFPTMGNEFPALDKVELDFTDWQLTETDAIMVEPFVSKLSRAGGLSSVIIRGVKNSTNLRQFREGLRKPGGTFTVVN